MKKKIIGFCLIMSLAFFEAGCAATPPDVQNDIEKHKQTGWTGKETENQEVGMIPISDVAKNTPKT